MPRGMAMAAAMSVARVVRSTVRQKSKPSRPLVAPFQSAAKVSVGEGSSTLSTTSYHTARYQTTIRPMTPTIGRYASKRSLLISCLANLALEHLEAMRLDAPEVMLSEGDIGARPGGVIMHIIGNRRRAARE